VHEVTWELHDRIGTVTLNRPEVKNAITIEMADEIAALLRSAQTSPDVHVVILTGAGRAFCAGGDLNRLAVGHQPIEVRNRLTEHMHQVAFAVESLDKPLIAAVNGDAFGAGMDVALMCDFRFASRTARFSDGYILAGLVPGDGAAYYLPRIAGIATALDLLLTGRTVNADEAARLGLVHDVHEPTELLDAVVTFATVLAERPVELVKMVKRAVYESARSDLRTSLDLVAAQMGVIRSTEASAEALRSFMAHRRAPQA
jgi:enoyl-CoA hydratase/carnithine racemase